MSGLTHIDASGAASMVDVSAKDVTTRTAIAEGRVEMLPETVALIRAGDAKKGDVLGVARVAGIMAAKKTSDIIPLCHPLPLSKVEVDIAATADGSALEISATAETTGQTGVEMEALVAVSAAALTLYDMAKALDKALVISAVRLIEKSGGASGDYRRQE